MSSGRGTDRLSKAVNDLHLGSSEGGWEAVSRRPRNGRGGGKMPSTPWTQAQPTRAWGQPDTAQRLGMSTTNSSGSVSNDPRRGGWGPRQHQGNPGNGRGKTPQPESSWATEAELAATEENASNSDDEDEEDIDSDDDDYLMSDDYDSDEVPTHDSKKQHKMLRAFFAAVDKLTVEQLSEPARQWHCPACQGGPGAIDWYKGLQPLVTHAKTKGSVRVKLHRMFAELLDEELRRKGTSAVPAGEAFGQWAGLQSDADRIIVWPPMVIVTNTLLERDDNEKWIGMGNNELLEYFKDYAAVRAKHSYGPMGHRGLSILIFDDSAMGYVEAERLHKHFLAQGTGRSAWESNRKVLFLPGGKRQLYGFLAGEDDVEDFNRHCQGKTRLKYDMRSYKEKVVDEMKKMSEDNQQLSWYKSKAAKEQGRIKVLEESFNVVSEKLRNTMEENRIVRQRTTMQHEQNKEEMDFQEQFFNDLQKIYEATSAKENQFEKQQQEKRKKKVEESKADDSKMDDLRQRAEEVSKFKEFQEQEIEKFVAEREMLIRAHENTKMEMKKKHWAEELQLEKDFDTALTKLMEKYASGPIEGGVAGDRA